MALGFFDGVHLGHRKVIEGGIGVEGAVSVVLTFEKSPAQVLGNDTAGLLTDNEQKAQILRDMGVQAVIFADFAAMMDMSPEQFAKDVLAEQLGATKVVCGYNYRFGKNGAGDTECLRRLGEKYSFAVEVCAPVEYGGQSVSSTRIRACIARGDIEEANRMLARELSIRGEIREGNHIGTTLGYPTVNLPIAREMAVPPFGVYASRLELDGQSYRGVTNIGVHPTVGESKAPLCETFLLNFDGQVYGRDAVCRLLGFVRPERKFDSIEELKAQVERDVRAVEDRNRKVE